MKPGKAPLAVAAGAEESFMEWRRQARRGWRYRESTLEMPQARNGSGLQEQDPVHVLNSNGDNPKGIRQTGWFSRNQAERRRKSMLRR